MVIGINGNDNDRYNYKKYITSFNKDWIHFHDIVLDDDDMNFILDDDDDNDHLNDASNGFKELQEHLSKLATPTQMIPRPFHINEYMPSSVVQDINSINESDDWLFRCNDSTSISPDSIQMLVARGDIIFNKRFNTIFNPRYYLQDIKAFFKNVCEGSNNTPTDDIEPEIPIYIKDISFIIEALNLCHTDYDNNENIEYEKILVQLLVDTSTIVPIPGSTPDLYIICDLLPKGKSLL
jgi:hypothetical protein